MIFRIFERFTRQKEFNSEANDLLDTDKVEKKKIQF